MTNSAASIGSIAAAVLTAVIPLPTTAQSDRPRSAITGLRFSQVAGGGGVPLNVVEKGDPADPAILFIHGYRQSYLSWTYQFESAIAERCHLIAFDLRGHGNSGAPWQAGAYTDDRSWAADVAAVVKATGARRPLIVAWSFGGAVAMDFLRYHREIPIGGLVLVDTLAGLVATPFPANAPPRPTATPDLAQNIRGVEASTRLLFGAAIDPALTIQFAAAAMRVSPIVDRAIAGSVPANNTDLVGRLPEPVMLVFGDRDPILPQSTAAKVAAAVPKARVETFAGAGHAPFLEDPARFNAMLDAAQCARGRK